MSNMDDFDNYDEFTGMPDQSSSTGTSAGYNLLKKIGWGGESQGLGKSGQGIKEIISLNSNVNTLGLGMLDEYDKACADATKDRKKLNIEMELTEDEILARQKVAERELQIEDDVKHMNREFYCDICDKQYKNVSEMANHLSSYDHHHKKRFMEMKKDEKKRKGGSDSDTHSKKLREEKRSMKELERRMSASYASSSVSTVTQLTEDQQSKDTTTEKGQTNNGSTSNQLVPQSTLSAMSETSDSNANGTNDSKPIQAIKFGFVMKKSTKK
jgi:hypothetical protein